MAVLQHSMLDNLIAHFATHSISVLILDRMRISVYPGNKHLRLEQYWIQWYYAPIHSAIARFTCGRNSFNVAVESKCPKYDFSRGGWNWYWVAAKTNFEYFLLAAAAKIKFKWRLKAILNIYFGSQRLKFIQCSGWQQSFKILFQPQRLKTKSFCGWVYFRIFLFSRSGWNVFWMAAEFSFEDLTFSLAAESKFLTTTKI